ncbi:MAG: hypothetical protein ACTHJ0_12540 [Flavipsychrobacter sp.]
MKPFRNVLFTSLLVLTAFSAVLYTACSKVKCGGTTCQNGGTCSENKCLCLTGYSGNDCGTSWSSKFIATYTNCSKTCSPSSGSGTWQSIITANGNSGQDSVVISNFAGYNTSVVAGVDSLGHIYIDPTSSSGIVGSGIFSSNDNSITIKFSEGGIYCTMIMKR